MLEGGLSLGNAPIGGEIAHVTCGSVVLPAILNQQNPFRGAARNGRVEEHHRATGGLRPPPRSQLGLRASVSRGLWPFAGTTTAPPRAARAPRCASDLRPGRGARSTAHAQRIVLNPRAASSLVRFMGSHLRVLPNRTFPEPHRSTKGCAQTVLALSVGLRCNGSKRGRGFGGSDWC
jgi:hypothetical protein